MNKDNKKLILNLALIFLAVVLSYKLPHHSYSLLQFIFKPISFGSSTIFLPGIIFLCLIVYGISGYLHLERFKNRNKFIQFLLLIILIIPFMKWSIDVARTCYYQITQEQLNAVDIKESDFSIGYMNEKLILTVDMQVIDYGKSLNRFKFKVYLPNQLSHYTGITFVESTREYLTSGNRNTQKILESFELQPMNGKNFDNDNWIYEDVKYELFNENEVVEIIDYGL